MASENTYEFTEEDTSVDKVLAFLKTTNDKQEFHQEGVMPGAFYLTLISKYLDSPPKKLNAQFQDLRFYPFQGKIDIKKEHGETTFRIYDDFYTEFGNRNIATITAQTDSSQPEHNVIFAYHLPGKLLDAWENSRKLKDGFSAIYNSQEISFSTYSSTDELIVEQEIPDKENKRNIFVPVSCLNQNKRKTLEGLANVTILKKDTLKRMIKERAKKLGIQ